MGLRTGDLVMVGPGPNKPGLFARGIMQTTGSVHWHDELVMVDPAGNEFVGYAHAPHFELIPFYERIEQYSKGEISFAVFRWHEFTSEAHERGEWYAVWRESVRSSLKLLDALRVPYDKQAISSIARNVLRKKLHLGSVLKQKEHRVYCTESCRLVYEVAGIDILRPLGRQPFPAPIHMERLWKLGCWVLFDDAGLREQLEARYGGC